MNLTTVKRTRKLWREWDATSDESREGVAKLVEAKRMLRRESPAVERLLAQGATLGAILDLMAECGIGDAG